MAATFEHRLRVVGENHIVVIQKISERFEFNVYEKADEFKEENHLGIFWSYANEPLADFIKRLIKLTSGSFKILLNQINYYYTSNN